MRNSQQKMLEGKNWFLEMIPHVVCSISTMDVRHASVCEKNCLFSAIVSFKRRFSASPKWGRSPCWPSGFHMHSCRQDAAALGPEMSPQENVWVVCWGAPPRLQIHLGFIWVILVSCCGQSRTIFPKERPGAWEWRDLKSETVLSCRTPPAAQGRLSKCCRRHLH